MTKFRPDLGADLISAILLAAGQSKRMGRTKQLLKFGKSTIVEETVRELLGSSVDELVVVLGHDADKLKASIDSDNKRIRFTVNKDYRSGIGSSIRCGVLSASSDSVAFLIALADQPLIKSGIIDLLIRSYRSSGVGIVVPTYKGVNGHPVIMAKKYYNELIALRGDVGARQLLKDHQEDALLVEVDAPEILLDIDREDDYARIRNRLPNSA
ncbi:MAG: nucleotidyltransferase family protein [Candidatus Bathyarchaeota archaeon]|nr:nucleotidyltransferase family protein [Candidatus Bathyarchaeota archaeon]